MANIVIDLTYTNLKDNINGVSTYTFKDLGTSNMKIQYKKVGHQQIPYLYDKNTSNIDMMAIKTSLKNLFSFLPGQQILQPQFGNKLYTYIYQPMSDIVQVDIKRTIKQMIQHYQPRIRLTDITIHKNNQKLSYNIIMKYIVPQLGLSNSEILQLSASDGITFR